MRDDTAQMLWVASGELTKLATETCMKIIDISTKMLVKNNMIGKTPIPMIMKINETFLKAHNVTTEKMLREKMAHSEELVASKSDQEIEKMSLEPEFRKFCKEMGMDLDKK